MPPQRGTRTAQPEQRQTGSRRGTMREGGPAAATRLPMLRTSERSTLKKCEFVWDLEFNRLLKPTVAMPALRFGTLVHKALAEYYIPGVKRGRHPAIAFEEAYYQEQKYIEEHFGLKVGDIEGEEKWVDALELGVAMMNNYVDEYGADYDWEVLVTEHPFEVVVYKPGTEWHAYVRQPGTGMNICGVPGCRRSIAEHDERWNPEPWFKYVGILDGVWRKRSDGSIWIPDHKTTDGIGDKKWTHLVLDDQAGAYWSWGVDYLAQEAYLEQNQKLSGMLYNFLRKAMPDERPSRFEGGRRVYLNLDGSVSKRQPLPYFKRLPVFRDEYDRNQAKQRAMRDYARIELFRSGQLPMTKSPGMFTCPSCWARDICELHETGHDYESFIRETTRTWGPYEEHSIYDGR